MSASNVFANIFKWTQLAIAAVAIVEQTAAQDTGKGKQQTALDIIANEAPVIGAALPNVPGLPQSIINLTVAAFNIAGWFTHKSAPTAPTPPMTPPAPTGS
jgi:hypothetical protein